MLPLFFLLALVAFVSAQSEECINSITSLGGHPELSSCLNFPGIVSIFTAGNSTSLIPPINSWLTGLCGAPACSDATLTAVVANLSTSCADEMGNLGFDIVFQSAVAVRKGYPIARKVLCLKDGSDNCITKTLQAYESKMGTLTGELFGKLLFTGSSEIPRDLLCTDCTKAMQNVVSEGIPEVANNATYLESVEQVCGADFTDGEIPSNIVNSASSESAQDDGAAASVGSGLYIGVVGSFFAAGLSLL
ncbi:hypothetical protein BKA70DRAFT_1420688 [Coprinopsis sp. MPI-PUGE-AT-0042]|nr:hypothetical protein BKA70DRAFT_1420688 [Coprinopsis sp. MPI-PUGE-AT-0042]